MAKKSKKYTGVYSVEGKTGISFGIDYIHPQTGQRIKKIVKECASEKAAFEARSMELADAKRGALNKAYGIKSKGSPILFEDMTDQYLKYWSKENKNYRTDKQRASALKKAFAGKLMSDLTPWMVEKFKSNMAKEKAKSTINKYLSLGSQVFEKAAEWGKYNGENPFLKVGRYKVKRGKKPGSLSPEQVAAIMDEIKHSVKRDMVEFGFNTGWRISEITGLKWSDIRLDKGLAWIADPKNGDPVQIELNDEAISIISRQKKTGRFIFCHKNGNPYKTGITAAFKNAAFRAGVYLPPRKAWHILRRTWASMFLQSGGDVETLRELGNWKDYSMPMWYADAANSAHKKKVLNRIPKVNGRKLEEMGKVVKLTN